MVGDREPADLEPMADAEILELRRCVHNSYCITVLCIDKSISTDKKGPQEGRYILAYLSV